MNDFLQFLNTASADSLTKIPGISSSLAENLIAARPFETIEDCLKVRGIGKNLLARAQASFEKVEPEMIPEEHALIPAESQESREITPVEKSTPAAEPLPAPAKSSFGSRLGGAVLWFFRALLRLILIVLVIGGIGAAIYYGAPLVNEKFVAPVEQNTARVRELQNEIETLRTQLAEINDQVADLNQQLSETNTRIEGIEQSVQAHTASLETLANMQSTLETQLKETNDKTLLALKHEVMLTRVLDMLARARLFLAQSNFGLAKADVQSARDLLAELQADEENEVQAQALERLDMALANLPDFPVVASGDLEITWQILMSGKTVATATPEPAPTVTVTPQATLEITPTVTATP